MTIHLKLASPSKAASDHILHLIHALAGRQTLPTLSLLCGRDFGPARYAVGHHSPVMMALAAMLSDFAAQPRTTFRRRRRSLVNQPWEVCISYAYYEIMIHEKDFPNSKL
jgi:hypothetical protein